ncbi:MAG: diguanylate cyclase [Methylotenera sp.]|uniref:diguanylate cyclase domain-containing protein n=1 Tax=Methylotenera sp. TaxID=2051956 RepID=UPI0024889A84|nr:diguanylate cyclase [Methylotenera sp.]MDI1308853.1 diguanylate cyclase [Methylotenera sp.]
MTWGIAIWALHFICMLAFHLPIPLAYDSRLTFISAIPAIVAAIAGFYFLRNPKLPLKNMLIGGLLMGLGIVSMHYVGMSALRIEPSITYKPILVILSIVIAITTSISALLIVYAGNKTVLHPLFRHLFGAIVLSLAIAGMHYTAMVGTVFSPNSICAVGNLQFKPHLLAVIVTSGCFLLFSGGGFANALDRHFAIDDLRLANMQLEEQQRELHLVASAFEVQEGVLVTDAKNIILRVNKSFTKLTGYSMEEVLGRSIEILISKHHNEMFYDDILKSLSDKKSWLGEIWSERKDGVINPYRLMITAVSAPDGHVTNYVAAISDIRDFKEAQENIILLAFHDPLTGLPNRRLLQDRLHQAITSSIRSHRYGAIIFIDLDHFKLLNDTLGHNFGDLLLIEVAVRLQDCVREGDTVSRLGGDEFVVMLEDLSDGAEGATVEAKIVGKKIIAAINQPFFLQDNEYSISCSMGVTLFHGNRYDVDELLKQADIAMYSAKNSGRNAMSFFNWSMKKCLRY